MRIAIVLSAVALLSGAASAAGDETFTAKVYVGGMSWAASWGGRIEKSLKGLEGASNVEMEFDEGLFTVTFKESAKVKPADIKKAVGRFELKRIELSIVGELSKDEKGLWLVARGSGTKYALANRPKKSDDDKPEDVLGKLEQFLKDGRKTVKVAGEATQKEDASSIALASAEVVEKKK